MGQGQTNIICKKSRTKAIKQAIQVEHIGKRRLKMAKIDK